MTDEQVPHAVAQEGFSEEVLAWMAEGDALATAPLAEASSLEDEWEDLGAAPAGRVRAAWSRVTTWWNDQPLQRRRTLVGVSAACLVLLGGLTVVRASSRNEDRPTMAANAITLPAAPAHVATAEPGSLPEPLLGTTAVVPASAHAHKSATKHAPKAKVAAPASATPHRSRPSPLPHR